MIPVRLISRPLTAAATSDRTSHYLPKAGITVPRPGSHTLRYSWVQQLIDAQLSLKAIGDYGGHRSPSFTQIYSKVTIATLWKVS